MKYNEFVELTSLVDDDILLIQEASTLALKKVKLSTLKQYVKGAASTINSKTLTYVADGDTGGTAYWLGTDEGKQLWANPHTAGRITCSMSSFFNSNFNFPERFVNRQIDDLIATANIVNSWFKIDFGLQKKLTCNYYSLRGRNFSSNHPRNWKLQGSNDDTSWIDLDTQTNNSSINQNTWLSLPVTTAQEYRYLRIYFTGVSSSNDNVQTMGEWEFYGTLRNI